jgi:uncharacterized cupin superfamily protein
MTDSKIPLAIDALDVPEPAVRTRYPEPFATLVRGRGKRRLGDVFGLTTFGVNQVRMAPHSTSSVRHHHSHEDEFVYVLSGRVTLVCDEREAVLGPGMCAGFSAGSGVAHQLQNRSEEEAVLLEIGSRIDGDEVVYPFDDLALACMDGEWVYTHKDGTPYPRHTTD